jgi:thiamine-phosphate pyrophosphorylase
MSDTFEKALGNSSKAFVNAVYALCDIQTLNKKALSLEDFIHFAQKHNAQLVQYRDKTSALAIQKKNLLYLKQHLNVPIIINDKAELLEYADGLHLGQEDFEQLQSSYNDMNKEMVFKLLRKQHPHKLFGLSTHNEMEVLQANTFDIDMIGLGAYRNTSTKDVSTILGQNLSYLAKMSVHPVCAIGGVQKEDTIEHVSFNVLGSALYED